MNILSRFLFLLVFLSLQASGQSPAAATPTTREFPEVSLRGFGTVSGTETASTIDGKAGSVLAITCEDADRAKLVLAKFLSDEQCLPGVTKQSMQAGQWGVGPAHFGGTPVTAWQVEDQGWIAAVRVGAKVLVAASPDSATLMKQLDGALASVKDKPVSEAEVKVPMWLDRFDQYGSAFITTSG